MDEAIIAAAERLDAFSDRFERGAVIDATTGLTRDDLDVLLTRLASTREVVMIPHYDMANMTREELARLCA